MPIGDLHTARLWLRPMRPDDEALYCGLYADAGVMRHVGEPLTHAAARHAFAAVMRQLAAVPPRSRYWILASRENGAGLGLMAWVPDRGDAGSAEVGVLLCGDAEGRGHATEAIATLADAVFADPAQRRLWTRHAHGNGLAVGLMRKLGFEPLPEASGPAPVRWQLARQSWETGRLAAFASLRATC